MIQSLGRGATCILMLALGLGAADAQAGSFDPDGYRGLTADRRAHRAGDTLTVIVLESTRASSQATTQSKRDLQISADLQEGVQRHAVGASIRGGDAGLGGTMRSGDVRAQLAVRIIDQSDEGLLRIAGNQVLTVNGEAQTIRLSGFVREDDIGADNTVLSNRISEAQIEFTGRGIVSDAQRQNIIYRVLRWLRLV